MLVLLIEPSSQHATALSADLQAEAFRIEQAETGRDALELLSTYEYDLVLLNLTLPDIDGSALIARIRAAKHDTPVVALSSMAKARIKALASGADDVVERSIDPAELSARIRAIVRRSRGFSQPQLRIGHLVLDIDRHEVVANNTRVYFTPKEFAILQLLVLRRNKVMTKEAILSQLYGGMDEPEIKIVDVFICKVRNKLAKAGLPTIIGTVWGRGYTVKDNGPDTPHCQPRRTHSHEPQRELVVA